MGKIINGVASEYEFPISKDDITFYGDTEEDRKKNEAIFDISVTIAQKDDEINKLNNTINKIKEIINNDKITGIEAKLLIKDLLESEVN